MQSFVCPECGHKSTFDPRIESAHCPQCEFTPTLGTVQQNADSRVGQGTHGAFLDELLAHWNGTHIPDPVFTIKTAEDAGLFFQDYWQALNMTLSARYSPTQQEILMFAGAYLWLRRGDRARAAQGFSALTLDSPRFADPWVWLTATTDEPAERLDYLGQAVSLEPRHPLAQDALAVVRGQGLPADRPPEAEDMDWRALPDEEGDVTGEAQSDDSLPFWPDKPEDTADMPPQQMPSAPSSLEPQTKSNLALGILGGLLGMIVGIAGWALISATMDRQIGAMAIGVGLLVGGGVHLLGGKGDLRLGLVGGSLSLIGCVVGNFFTAMIIISREFEIPFMELLVNLDLELVKLMMETFFGPIDFLFYGLALYAGFQFAVSGFQRRQR